MPAVFLIAAVGLGWLSWQGYQDIAIIQNQIKDSEDKIKVLNSAAEKVNNLVSYVKENPEASEKLNIALSDNSNKPNMVSVLASAAFSSGLLLKNIDFIESREAQAAAGAVDPAAPEKPAMQEVKLGFSGTYSSLKNFLIFTEKSLKLMDVVSVDFGSASTEKEKDQIANYNFTVSLKTYYIAKSGNISKESKVLLANNLVNLSFVKEKQFTELAIPQNYNIDTTDTGDWGNKNIF